MANFLENLLPTAGGILGGIGGAALGTVAAPFTGGIVNPIDAGIAGAGLGGAAGQAGENALTGKKVLQGNDVSSGVENAVGQATGAGVAKVAGGLLGKVGGLAGQGATKLIQGQAVKGALDSGTAGALRGYGITNLSQIGDIAPHVTTSDGALNQGVLRGLSESDQGVDLSGMGNEAKNLVADNQMQLKTNSIPDISNIVERSYKSILNPEDVSTMATRGGGSTTAYDPAALKNVTPENAFSVAKNFEQLAQTARSAGYDKAGNVTNPDQAAKYKVFSGLAEHAKNAAFGNGEPLPLTDANKAQIIQDLSPVKSLNENAYNGLVGDVSKAQSLQDLRGLQSPFVNANKALTATENAVDRGGGTSMGDLVRGAAPVAGGMAGGPAGLAGGLVLSGIGSKAADRVGAGTLDRVSNILTNPTVKNAVQTTLPAATTAAANVPNLDLSNPQGANGMQNAAGIQPTQGAGTAAAASPEALQMMLGLIGLQADPYMASSFTPMISGAAQPLQKAGAAQGALSGLEGLYNQAGGGVGGGNGILSRLQAMLPGSAGHLYNQQSAQLMQTLQGLGVPGTATPSLMSGGSTAQGGFNTLQQIVNALGGNPGSVLSTVPGA